MVDVLLIAPAETQGSASFKPSCHAWCASRSARRYALPSGASSTCHVDGAARVGRRARGPRGHARDAGMDYERQAR